MNIFDKINEQMKEYYKKPNDLLNELTDMIEIIEDSAYEIGFAEGKMEYVKARKTDRKRNEARNRAFRIINLLEKK
jgi:predicted house-cleaning noncanonical NTP pyrophosphatase (MazG superfamily)